MRKEKKASREEEELVCVVEWQDGQGSEDRKWLFVKRPEKGEWPWRFSSEGQQVVSC
jgi:A/G-specific adenine glycosylase